MNTPKLTIRARYPVQGRIHVSAEASGLACYAALRDWFKRNALGTHAHVIAFTQDDDRGLVVFGGWYAEPTPNEVQAMADAPKVAADLGRTQRRDLYRAEIGEHVTAITTEHRPALVVNGKLTALGCAVLSYWRGDL